MGYIELEDYLPAKIRRHRSPLFTNLDRRPDSEDIRVKSFCKRCNSVTYVTDGAPCNHCGSRLERDTPEVKPKRKRRSPLGRKKTPKDGANL